MKLKKLLRAFPQIQVKGSKEVIVTGVCADSRLVSPGNLFIARRGTEYDGTAYIEAAVAAGAIGVVTDLYDPSLKEITQLVHPNVADLEGALAAEYYQHPSRDLFLIGITGTNGKTTTAFLIRHLLQQLGVPCGLMGTIEHIVGRLHYTATRTTPSVAFTHKLLREMVRASCQAVAMEVTSHGLDQGRVNHLDFDVGIFTNLSQDHLDYHHDMESYAAAKAQLFTMTKQVVVNIDDPWHQRMLQDVTRPVITFGFSADAQVRAENVVLSLAGSQFEIVHGNERAHCQTSQIGRFNVSNCLAAAALGRLRGVPLGQIADALSSAPPIRGRLEQVPNQQGLCLFVDYSHTPDALKQVLSCLQELKQRRIVTLFGCGGARDQGKRPLMGAIATQLSDYVVITTDNPRREDPQTICDQITANLPADGNWEVCVDRREGIRRAVAVAQPGDIVLIAGKGHETDQIIGNTRLPFDDRQVAQEVLA